MKQFVHTPGVFDPWQYGIPSNVLPPSLSEEQAFRTFDDLRYLLDRDKQLGIAPVPRHIWDTPEEDEAWKHLERSTKRTP